MSLVISHGSSQLIINHVEFDVASNGFLCYDDKGDDPIFRYDLPYNLADLPNPGLTEKIYLFKNDLITSRRLFKLKLKDKPESNKLVGYIFPLNAFSDNPDIFDNIHLKKLAFNVLQKLLEEKDLSIKAHSPFYRTDAVYTLTDFYDEDLIVIVVCDQLVTFPNYSFEDYLPALYKLGFRIAPNFNFIVPSSNCDTILNNFSLLQATVTVGIPKNRLHLNYFISSLVKNELFLKDNEVARFHLYYQVIEMLMEKVYKNEVNIEVISKFRSLPSFDVKELLRETMKETYSLEKLVGSNYSVIDAEIMEELNFHIDTFLAYVGITYNGKGISSKIYKIRNILFHGYSKILENVLLDKLKVDLHLKKINDSFEYLIFDAITSYKDRISIATVPSS
jgi:hypothetical protein